MFWMLLILWAAIGYLDLFVGLILERPYPISVLYVLVILPAGVVFGRIGLAVSIAAVVAMYHFTHDKGGISTYAESEIVRLAFVSLVGIAFERVGRDRERIRTALEKLQRETKLREDLTHMLVHDLRTPLTGINTSLQTLQLGIVGDLEPDQRELVDFAVADGERLLEMVNQILDVARLESGEMPLRLQETEFAEISDAALRVMLPLAQESGIRMTQSCNNGLSARMDPDLMRRVLINLLGNAVKFTPRDGEVSVLAEGSENGQAHVVVKDSGWGIPEADLKRVFDKYAQVKGGGKAGPSTGLGLTFCRLAVEAHGGEIWAVSQVGKGTEMHITIPLAGPQQPLGSQRVVVAG